MFYRPSYIGESFSASYRLRYAALTKEIAMVRRSQHFQDSGAVLLSLQFEVVARPYDQLHVLELHAGFRA